MHIDLTDIALSYDDAGQGTPILFVHGFPHSRRLWDAQVAELAAECRCIVPDLRGFGDSDVRGPYSMDRYADDLAALLDALRIERCVVAGLSMGGYVAFAMWRRHRARIAGLVLADTRAEPDDDEARAKRRKMIDTARGEGMRAVADLMIQGMVGKSTRESNPALADQVYAMLASAPVEGTVGALEAMMDRADSTPTLGEIDVPTVIVVGDEDVLTPPKFARAMHEGIAGSRLTVIPRAGHVSNAEQPGAFNDAVRELLRLLPDR